MTSHDQPQQALCDQLDALLAENGRLKAAIAAAYRKGAEDMRGRCLAAANFSEALQCGGDAANLIMRRINALSLPGETE